MDVHLSMHASHAGLTSSCYLSFVVHTYNLYIYALDAFFPAVCPQACGLRLPESPWRTKHHPILVIDCCVVCLGLRKCLMDEWADE